MHINYLKHLSFYFTLHPTTPQITASTLHNVCSALKSNSNNDRYINGSKARYKKKVYGNIIQNY
jgi:hypothetical protein